jgi:DNA-binding protein H-NS
MGLKDRFRKLTKRAEDTAAAHKEQMDRAVEKAEATADQRTGGQYHDQIQKAGAKAQEMVDRLPEPQAGEGEDPASPPAGPAGPAEPAGPGQAPPSTR